jgi:hypothetical protein
MSVDLKSHYIFIIYLVQINYYIILCKCIKNEVMFIIEHFKSYLPYLIGKSHKI